MRLVTRGKISGLWLALQFAGGSLAAQRPGIEKLFPEQPTGYVTDVAHVIPADRAAGIQDVIERLRQATGAEIAVVTLPTIGDYDRADVAVAIGRQWKVGAKAEIGDPRRNAGIVILVVPKTPDQPGKLFIAVGRGLEGIVTDLLASRVRDQMRPNLAQGDYAGGIELGVRAVAALVAKGFGVTDSALTSGDRSIRQEQPRRREQRVPAWVVLVVVIAIFLLSRRAGSGGRRGGGGWFIWPGGFGGGGGGGSWGGFGGGGGGGGGFGGFGGGGGFSGGGSGGDF